MAIINQEGIKARAEQQYVHNEFITAIHNKRILTCLKAIELYVPQLTDIFDTLSECHKLNVQVDERVSNNPLFLIDRSEGQKTKRRYVCLEEMSRDGIQSTVSYCIATKEIICSCGFQSICVSERWMADIDKFQNSSNFLNFHKTAYLSWVNVAEHLLLYLGEYIAAMTKRLANL